jgi:hypothetical protein
MIPETTKKLTLHQETLRSLTEAPDIEDSEMLNRVATIS